MNKVIPKKGLNLKPLYLIWLINPLLSLVLSLRYIRYKKAIWLFLLFSFFFGLSFVIFEGSEADSVRYAQQLEELHNRNLTFNQIVNYLYNPDTNFVDIYQPLITWFVSTFTSNYKWLFAIFGLVYGWFLFNNIRITVIHLPLKINKIVLLLLIYFSLLLPIWKINGVRMWTAAQVFIYGVFLLELYKNKHGYYFIFASLFFHFSFFIAIAVYLMFKFTPNNIYAYLGVFIATFTLDSLNIEFFQDIALLFPEFMQDRTSYLGDIQIQRHQESLTAFNPFTNHISLNSFLSRYFLFLTSLIVYTGLITNKIKIDDKIKNLFLFGSLFVSVGWVLSFLPSGGRFVSIASMIIYAAIIITLGYNMLRWSLLRYWFYAASPVIIFMIIIRFRYGMDYFGIVTILGNPIVAMFYTDEIPIIDFIKLLF